jgi:quinol monooxygenase YgiN
MFVVIYQFQIKDNQKKEFTEAWKQLTELIYQYEGSLGSRLHQQSKNIYIAYAQWPNKDIWKSSGDKLPDTAAEIRATLKETCIKIEVLNELEVTEDFLKSETLET